MFGVVVIKETNKVHGIVSNLDRITSDSVFGENSSMEGINMDVCDIYAVDTELANGEIFPNSLEDFTSQFIFESDTEKIQRLTDENDLLSQRLSDIELAVSSVLF